MKKETLSETFCASNFNNFDRYISLINVKGRRRPIIIIAELTFDSRWAFISEKMRNFMPNKRGRPVETTTYQQTTKCSFAEVIKNRAKNNSIDFKELKMGNVICINGLSSSQNEVLKRSLVGTIEDGSNLSPALSQIRRWTNNLCQ